MKICRVFPFKIDERSIKKKEKRKKRKSVTVSAYLNIECNNTLLQWRVYFYEPRSFYFHGNSRARCIGALQSPRLHISSPNTSHLSLVTMKHRPRFRGIAHSLSRNKNVSMKLSAQLRAQNSLSINSANLLQVV